MAKVPGVKGSAGGTASGSKPGAPVRLSDDEVDQALKGVAEWSLVGEAIQRTYLFKDFVVSMAFVDEIAKAAEAAQHHPDILIRYNRVTLTLATHDAGGISAKDFDLAKKADELASRQAPAAKPKK
jgi:4a-hydroxytetrahydrobiopterin dehydratase